MSIYITNWILLLLLLLLLLFLFGRRGVGVEVMLGIQYFSQY